LDPGGREEVSISNITVPLESTNTLRDFMEKIKLLITTGDSISNFPSGPQDTWPKQLSDRLNCKAIYGGFAAASNAIIARNTINHVLEALKTYKAEEILVGVMWGIPAVADIYNSNFTIQHHTPDNPTPNVGNPTSVASKTNFYIAHPFWSDPLSTLWHDKFYDPIGSRILALEHILRIQWFLERHNITYFMFNR
jgi:hypothetical protein